MYSVSIRNIAKRTVPRIRPATFAPTSVRSRKIESGISASRARASQATNPIRSTSATVKKPIVAAEPQQRAARARVPGDDPDQEHEREGEEAGRRGGAPAVLVRLRDRVDERDEAARDERGAGQVEAARVVVTALGQQDGRGDEGRDP